MSLLGLLCKSFGRKSFSDSFQILLQFEPCCEEVSASQWNERYRQLLLDAGLVDVAEKLNSLIDKYRKFAGGGEDAILRLLFRLAQSGNREMEYKNQELSNQIFEQEPRVSSIGFKQNKLHKVLPINNKILEIKLPAQNEVPDLLSIENLSKEIPFFNSVPNISAPNVNRGNETEKFEYESFSASVHDMSLPSVAYSYLLPSVSSQLENSWKEILKGFDTQNLRINGVSVNLTSISESNAAPEVKPVRTGSKMHAEAYNALKLSLPLSYGNVSKPIVAKNQLHYVTGKIGFESSFHSRMIKEGTMLYTQTNDLMNCMKPGAAQALCEKIKAIHIRYLALISTKQLQTKEIISSLKELKLAHYIVKKTCSLKSFEILSFLYERSTSHDSYYWELFRHVYKNYFEMLCKWIYRGELHDPNNEFFISIGNSNSLTPSTPYLSKIETSTPGLKSTHNFLLSAVTFNPLLVESLVPSFLRENYVEIYQIGIYVRVLQSQPVISSSLPSSTISHVVSTSSREKLTIAETIAKEVASKAMEAKEERLKLDVKKRELFQELKDAAEVDVARRKKLKDEKINNELENVNLSLRGMSDDIDMEAAISKLNHEYNTLEATQNEEAKRIDWRIKRLRLNTIRNNLDESQYWKPENMKHLDWKEIVGTLGQNFFGSSEDLPKQIHLVDGSVSIVTPAIETPEVIPLVDDLPLTLEIPPVNIEESVLDHSPEIFPLIENNSSAGLIESTDIVDKELVFINDFPKTEIKINPDSGLIILDNLVDDYKSDLDESSTSSIIPISSDNPSVCSSVDSSLDIFDFKAGNFSCYFYPDEKSIIVSNSHLVQNEINEKHFPLYDSGSDCYFRNTMRFHLNSLITTRSEIVNCDLMRLFQSRNIYGLFNSLANCFLFQAGDIMTIFCCNLFRWSRTAICNAASRSSCEIQINRIWQESCKSINYVDGQNFVFRLTTTDIILFDGLQLEIDISFPEDIIIAPECLNFYSKLFSFLIKLRRVAEELEDLWKIFTRIEVKGDWGQRIRQMHIFRHEMYSLVTVLQNYVMNQILEARRSWENSEEINASQMKENHEIFLKKCFERCFLDEKQVPVMKMFVDLFTQILEFKKLVLNLNITNVSVFSNTRSKVNNFEELPNLDLYPKFLLMPSKFRNTVGLLYRVLVKLIERGVDLEQLRISIDYNNFYNQLISK